MLTRSQVFPEQPFWLELDADPSTTRQRLPMVAERLFDLDRHDAKIASTRIRSGIPFVGLFGTPHIEAFSLRTDRPLLLAEAGKARLNGEIVVAVHPIQSLRAIGDCAANQCVALKFDDGPDKELTIINGEVETEFADVLGYSILAMLAEYGPGYDAIHDPVAADLTRQIVGPGHHTLLLPYGDEIHQLQ
jgi:hypothetical protein